MTPRKRKPGNPSGKLGAYEVEQAAKSAGLWSLALGGLEYLGRDILQSLPLLSVSLPFETVIVIAVVGFVLIFLGKLWFLKRSDNTGRE